MSNLFIGKETSLLFNSWHAVDELYVKYAKSVGLTYLGLVILDTIYNMPNNCTQKAICEKTDLPKQSVNAIIRSFLNEGYIELKEIDTDRRNKEIRLSKSGKEYGDKVIGKLVEVERKLVESLAYEERQSMINLMNKAERVLRDIIHIK